MDTASFRIFMANDRGDWYVEEIKSRAPYNFKPDGLIFLIDGDLHDLELLNYVLQDALDNALINNSSHYYGKFNHKHLMMNHGRNHR